MAVDSKLAKFSCFQKLRFLFRKNRLFLENKLSRNPTDSFDTATTLLPLTIYLKSSIFSLENPIFFEKKNKFCTFWGSLLFQSHSTAKLIPLAVSKKFQNFSENLFIFSEKQIYFEDFEKTANFSCILQQKSYLQSFQSEFIFLENPCTFLEQPRVWTFWEMLAFKLNSTAKLLPQAIFFNFEIFVQKTLFLFYKSLKFELFEDCYNFNRFYGKFAAFAILKDYSFSRKTEVFFKTSTSHKLNVLRNLPNSLALYSKFVTISDFQKLHCFFGKPVFFLQKTHFLNVLRNLTVPFAFDIKLANCFSRSRYQIG